MGNLQIERSQMAESESKIREIIGRYSPGETVSKLIQTYISLSSNSERVAFVSVLAANVATSAREDEQHTAKIRL